MIPVGYRPIRIIRTEPTLSRWWLVVMFFLYGVMEYFYPSL